MQTHEILQFPSTNKEKKKKKNELIRNEMRTENIEM